MCAQQLGTQTQNPIFTSLCNPLRGSSSLMNHNLIIAANPHMLLGKKKPRACSSSALASSHLQQPIGRLYTRVPNTASISHFLPDFQCNTKAFQGLLPFHAEQCFHTSPDFSLFISKCFCTSSHTIVGVLAQAQDSIDSSYTRDIYHLEWDLHHNFRKKQDFSY